MRDATLDEFVRPDADPEASEDDGDVEAPDEGGAGAPDAVDETAPEDGDDVEPAVPTYDWTPGGATCADCGATVEARWRDDDAMVCGDCKDW